MLRYEMTVEDFKVTFEADNLDEFKTQYVAVGGLAGLWATVQELDEQIAKANLAAAGLNPQPVADAPEAKPDELAGLIENAPDGKALEGLYRAHKTVWNGAYNDLAKKRRAQLDKQAKKEGK